MATSWWPSISSIERAGFVSAPWFNNPKGSLKQHHAYREGGLSRSRVGDTTSSGNEAFAVMLGDDIIDSAVPCMKQMIDLFEKLQSSIIATCEVPHSEIHQYGVIRGVPVEGFNGRVFRVQDVVEKPPASEAPSNMAIIGRYILTPEIFNILEKTRTGRGGEIQQIGRAHV